MQLKRALFPLKLTVVFVVAFSLIALQGSLSSGGLLPTAPVARALLAPTEPWYPAGASMDTLVYKIFADTNTEITALSNGQIDIPDTPLPPPSVQILIQDASFYVTQPISAGGYAELEFHLGSSLWGCNQDYGNSACGLQIRQAIAHSIDKTILVQTQTSLAGAAQPLDNPVPPSVDLVLPNPCGWDASHPQSGSNCVVGENGVSGGVSYHLASAQACGVGSCNSTPGFSWTPGLGTPDFCAAADHFVAAGLAAGKDGGPGTGTCVLTGISSQASASPVSFFIRSDDAVRDQVGQSVVQFICALFTGVFTANCPTYVSVTEGSIMTFTGFETSTTTVQQGWNIYTAAFSNIVTFDSSLFFSYQSRFVSGIPSIKQSGGGHCSNDSFPSYAAPNYMYLCDPNYDAFMTQAEFSSCISAAGDPTNGQVTPTFANCPDGRPTATSASYKAQDEFGKNAFTIPWWASGASRFAYPSSWQRVVLHKSDGFTPPGNIPAEFNAWSPNPAVPGTIRQGYREPPTSLNPFISSTVWDVGLTGNIWDSPGVANPDSPQATLDWMTVSTQILQNNQLTYTPPVGTVETYRYTFRNDIFWQTGQKMTAWDAAFSYIAFKATGTPPGAGLAPMFGVKVLSPTQMDVNINGFGPFTSLFLSTTPVIPARFWGTCTATTWDSAASNPSFAAANSVLTPCIGPSVTSSGVILPSGSGVDPSKILPAFDPLASGILVGSGRWVCRSQTGTIGSGCSSTGTQSVAPGGVFTLQRYGYGTTPGGSLNSYFRSSGSLALWAWSGNTGGFGKDFLNFGAVALCFGMTPVPVSCSPWSMGIGNPSGSSGSPAPIGLTQVGIVQRFVGVNWVSPYSWSTSPPSGIAAFPPVLYEGISTGNLGNPFPAGSSQTLNAASMVGCTNSYNSGGGYDC